MDKYPGDAAKIIDQSESFLLGGGGGVRTSQSCKDMNRWWSGPSVAPGELSANLRILW